MSAHIPGPWSATFEGHRFVIECCGKIGRKALAVTAGAYPSHEANARLIASAPDLLLALQSALESMDARNDDCGLDHVRQQARAAIARATS